VNDDLKQPDHERARRFCKAVYAKNIRRVERGEPATDVERETHHLAVCYEDKIDALTESRATRKRKAKDLQQQTKDRIATQVEMRDQQVADLKTDKHAKHDALWDRFKALAAELDAVKQERDDCVRVAGETLRDYTVKVNELEKRAEMAEQTMMQRDGNVRKQAEKTMVAEAAKEFAEKELRDFQQNFQRETVHLVKHLEQCLLGVRDAVGRGRSPGLEYALRRTKDFVKEHEKP